MKILSIIIFLAFIFVSMLFVESNLQDTYEKNFSTFKNDIFSGMNNFLNLKEKVTANPLNTIPNNMVEKYENDYPIDNVEKYHFLRGGKYFVYFNDLYESPKYERKIKIFEFCDKFNIKNFNDLNNITICDIKGENKSNIYSIFENFTNTLQEQQHIHDELFKNGIYNCDNKFYYCQPTVNHEEKYITSEESNLKNKKTKCNRVLFDHEDDVLKKDSNKKKYKNVCEILCCDDGKLKKRKTKFYLQN